MATAGGADGTTAVASPTAGPAIVAPAADGQEVQLRTELSRLKKELDTLCSSNAGLCEQLGLPVVLCTAAQSEIVALRAELSSGVKAIESKLEEAESLRERIRSHETAQRLAGTDADLRVVADDLTALLGFRAKQISELEVATAAPALVLLPFAGMEPACRVRQLLCVPSRFVQAAIEHENHLVEKDKEAIKNLMQRTFAKG
jgi:hypothetical protein